MGSVQPLFVDIETARHMLGDIGKTKLFELLKSRKLRRAKIGARTLIEVESIYELAASSMEAA